MSKTAVADIIIPTQFERYVIERTAELSAFGQCGVIEHDPAPFLPRRFVLAQVISRRAPKPRCKKVQKGAEKCNQAWLLDVKGTGLRPTAIPNITARARYTFRLVNGVPQAFEADGQAAQVGNDGVTPFSLAEWLDAQMSEHATNAFAPAHQLNHDLQRKEYRPNRPPPAVTVLRSNARRCPFCSRR